MPLDINVSSTKDYILKKMSYHLLTIWNIWDGVQARKILLLFGVHQIIQEVYAVSAAPEKFW